MPTPRPPKLNAANLSQQELKRAAQQIGRANNLSCDPPLQLIQGPTGSHFKIDDSANWFLARLTAVYTLTSSDVAADGMYPGMTAGTNLYAFIEQAFDPTSGLPQDVAGGRQTITTTIGSTVYPLRAFALEDDNSLIVVPGTVPTGYAAAGPYVEMRLRGVVQGTPVFEFEYGSSPLSLDWVKVTNSTPQTINLGRTVYDGVVNATTTLTSATANFTSLDVGDLVICAGYISPGTTIATVVNSTTVTMSISAGIGTGLTVQIVSGQTRGYAAVIDTWSSAKGTWTDGAVVWAKEANEGALQNLTRYQCRPAGRDDMNVPIWMTSVPSSWLESTAGPTALNTTWTDTGISVNLPQNTVWKLTAQITGDITGGPNSPFGTGDYLQFRFYDSANDVQYGVTVTCCYIICAGEFTVDSAPLNAIIQTPANSDPSVNKDIVVKIQGMVVTGAAGSSGNMEASILDAVQVN